MRRARGRSAQRGATLIEALIALAALGVGAAGVLSLLVTVTRTNERLGFHNRSVELAAEVAAQIQDAACDVRVGDLVVSAASRDPGLAPGGPYDAPLPGSGIRTVGDLDGRPPIRIRYTVAEEDRALAPEGPPALDVTIEIREITRDPARDDPAVINGYWIRRFPVKKICNLRLELSGRGEYY
jgi:type II secretory pathway pseudopilin PulG